MIEQWLSVAYQNEKTKVAHRSLIDQLKTLPLDELIKAANGDPTSKLASIDGPEDKQWIDKYKGTPLFEKAVDLEKQLLQIDMQENQEHAARREAEKAEEPRTNFYDQRDAIKLQQRMLDLELVTSQEGGAGAGDPEAKEEQGAQLIEQAQAQEAAEGKGNEPHEQAETAALNQFRQAQQQEVAEAPKTASFGARAERALSTLGRGAKRTGELLSGSKVPSGYRQAHSALDELEHDKVLGARLLAGGAAAAGGVTALKRGKPKEKTAGSNAETLVPETRSLGRTPAGDHAQGAGVAEVASDPSATVTEGLQLNKTAGIGSSLLQAGKGALSAGKGALANAGGVSGLGSKALTFAKANPLATAGIAGGAGLLAGKALSRPQQQQQKVAALDIRKALKGATQLPLG